MEINGDGRLPQADPDLHQEPDKITNQLKAERMGTQFEKNYPKNIFIPIIEYLAEMGLKQDYERCVGTREEFQGKNVVSLSLIYQLLSKDWFLNTVNKSLLEANISNKILMNSKIKKKLFHLKVVRVLLHSNAQGAKQYKKIVSRAANSIANTIQEDDDLFDHPSSIIYLLNMFLSVLRRSYKQTGSSHYFDSEHSNSSPVKQHNSKEQFKNLTKSIISLLNRFRNSSEWMRQVEEKICEMIRCRAKEINLKFQLAENVPSWEFFNQMVVQKSFRSKLEGSKITNSVLNQWILEFKQKSSQIGLSRSQGSESMPRKQFTPVILILPPEE